MGAFKAAPTLVKVLAADLYLTALWVLGLMITLALWGEDELAGLTDNNPDAGWHTGRSSSAWCWG